MRFLQEFKIFESTQELPEFGTKWINEKGEEAIKFGLLMLVSEAGLAK